MICRQTAKLTFQFLIDSDDVHPTQKPIDLMKWLVTMVTAKEQIIIDPFCGSGTTCSAAQKLGRQFIGIEQDEWYADISRARCGLELENPDKVTGNQQTNFSQF